MPARRFALLGSPLSGVSSDAWQRFVVALETQPVGVVSKSGGLGSYDIRPRRLVELGYASGLRSFRCEGRQIRRCDFTKPWTQKLFLSDPFAQYAVLARSMHTYYDALCKGEIERPRGASLAGTLAVLHVGGKGALKGWPKLFSNTKALYDRAKGAF